MGERFSLHKWGVWFRILKKDKWIELAENRHLVSFLYITEEILGFIA
jgi:hypothetical protein